MDLIIVGNGFSKDLRNNYMDTLRDWDTSKPLSWKIEDPTHKDVPLLQTLSRLNSAISEAKERLQSASDFELINYVADQAQSTPEDLEKGLLRTEIYIFLSLAYSNFDIAVNALDTNLWKWQKFLNANKSNIIGAVSFNYDLILERTLRKLGLQIYAYGVQEQPKGLFVGKPHGSIDYEVGQGTISMPVQIPPTNAVYRNDTSLKRLHYLELQVPRIQCELVPPLEASMIRNFQWVAPIFSWIKSVSQNITRCIIIGISYSLPDRPEIDEILDSLNNKTEVIIANPHPPDDLKKALMSRSLKYQNWRKGPQL